MGEEEPQYPPAAIFIREHANGWIAQIEAGEVAGKWHVAAYPTDGDEPEIPVHGYVLGDVQARQLADDLVQDHAPHACSECGQWREPAEEEG